MAKTSRYKWSDSLLQRTDLSPGCKMVGQFLCNRADNKTLESWPSQAVIAAGVGVSVRWVRSGLQSLQAVGLIQDVGSHGEDPRYATRVYKLCSQGGTSVPPSDRNSRSALRPEPQFRSEPNPGRNSATIQGGTPAHNAHTVSLGTDHKRTSQKSTPTEYAAKPHQPPSKSAESKPKKPRPRNVLWDAVCETFKLEPKTRAQCTRVGKRAKEFGELGATPADIQTRAQRHRTTWPDCECSPESLLKWWNKFGKPIRPDWMPEPAKGVDEK